MKPSMLIVALLATACDGEPVSAVTSRVPPVVSSPSPTRSPAWWPDCEVGNLTSTEPCDQIKRNLKTRQRYAINRMGACYVGDNPNAEAQCVCWVYGDCDWADRSHAVGVETPEYRKQRRADNGLTGCDVFMVTKHTSCKALRYEASRRMRHHMERGRACEDQGNAGGQCSCWIYGDCDWDDDTQALSVVPGETE